MQQADNCSDDNEVDKHPPHCAISPNWHPPMKFQASDEKQKIEYHKCHDDTHHNFESQHMVLKKLEKLEHQLIFTLPAASLRRRRCRSKSAWHLRGPVRR